MTDDRGTTDPDDPTDDTTDDPTDDTNDDPTDDPTDDTVVEPLAVATDPVATARRRHGVLGAVLAGGMFGLDQALGRKVKEEAPIVIAASDEPMDIDTAGILVPVDDEISVIAPAQPRSDPFALPRRRPRRSRR